MSWPQYVRSITTDNNAEIARRSTIDATTVGRWYSDNTPHVRPGTATLFARAYGRPVLEAFVAAGLLEASDARVKTIPMPLSAYDTIELIDELRRRETVEAAVVS